MADILMINKITPSVDYNQWLKCIDTQPNEPINQHSTNKPKAVKPNSKKTLLKNFGDQCNKQSNASPSLKKSDTLCLKYYDKK